jgi:hypothetical protein
MTRSVYIIDEGGRGCIKIGIAHDVASRVKSLSGGNPRTLKVIREVEVTHPYSAKQVEAFLHSRCADHRVRGEWFDRNALPIALRFLSDRSTWPKKRKSSEDHGPLPWSFDDKQKAVNIILSTQWLTKKYPTDAAIADHTGIDLVLVHIFRHVWEGMSQRERDAYCRDDLAGAAA